MCSAIVDPSVVGESNGSLKPRSSLTWIQSPAYDLAFFSLAPLTSTLFLMLYWYSPIGSALATFVAFGLIYPHYISSFSFYFDDENINYFCSRWQLYFLGPVLIFLTVFVMRISGLGGVLMATIIVWNVFHISQQSAGILSVYRKLGGGPAAEKLWAKRALVFVSATMAFWFIERSEMVYLILSKLDPLLPDVVRLSLLGLAMFCCYKFLMQLSRRPGKVSFAEKVFMLSSFLMFHPFLWVENNEKATLAVLCGHVIQYLGFIWLFNRRKYATDEGSVRQRWLGRVSQNIPLLLLYCAGIGALFVGINELSKHAGNYLPFAILGNTIALCHFYVDGLFWAFRNPYVQRTVGPYLTGYRKI